MSRFIALAVSLLILGSLGFGQTSTSVHISGGDATSWAMVRISGGGVAHLDDIGGVHIGDIHKSEIIVVRERKAYVITDEKVFAQVDALATMLDKPREERLKQREFVREVRNEQRDVARQVRSLDRETTSVERQATRDGDAGKSERDRALKEIEVKRRSLEGMTKDLIRKLDEANKRVDNSTRVLDAARIEYQKKLNKIFDEAIASGAAKLFPG